MLSDISILVVEDDNLAARNMAIAIADRDCLVVGPVPTVAEALILLERSLVDAAVLDASLLDRNVTPVAMALIDKGIPFVIHTGVGLPEDLASVFPQVSVIMKPTDPDDVVLQLLGQVEKLRDVAAGKVRYSGLGGVDEETRQLNVDRVASALFEHFGDKAIILARRQSAGADGDVLAAWSAIIEKLAGKQLG